MAAFKNVQILKHLYSHEGHIKIIIEGQKKNAKKFECCQDDAVAMESKKHHKEEENESKQNIIYG